jgi:hypothetical protein
MATLHNRKTSNPLYEKLRQQARFRQHSGGAEEIVRLQNSLVDPKRTPAEILAAIQQRRSFHPQSVGAPDSTSLLRTDRERS